MMKLPQPLFDVPSTQKKAKATDPVRQPHDRRVFSTLSNTSSKRRVRSYALPIAPFFPTRSAIRAWSCVYLERRSHHSETCRQTCRVYHGGAAIIL